MKITAWRKSSYSGGGQQACVEIGVAPGTVGVRDTKNRETGHLAVSRTAWKSFIGHVSR